MNNFLEISIVCSSHPVWCISTLLGDPFGEMAPLTKTFVSITALILRNASYLGNRFHYIFLNFSCWDFSILLAKGT